MWRRVASLSSLLSSSNSAFSNQVKGASGSSSWRAFSTDILTPENSGNQILERSPFVAFVLGGPGSGKGTQCAKIAKTFGFVHVNAVDLLKDLILSNSEQGSKVRRSIIDGKFQLSEMTVKLLQKEMESTENYKFVIEGFPRNQENRIAFEKTFGSDPNMVLYLDCPEEEMIERALKQHEDKEDEQDRFDDDVEDVVVKRLEVFEAHTLPVIEHYSNKGLLHKIDAVGTVDEVFTRVHLLFGEFKADLAEAKFSRLMNHA